MRPKFDVIRDGWIPVADAGGKRELLGIRETLSRAHELRAVSDASPLVEYSVYRFLCVFLMDALRPEDIDTLEEYLEDGCFDMERIDAYIDRCREEGVSFDLFDEERPFLQVRYDSAIDKEPKPITTLNCELPTGNSHLHFDHRVPEAIVYQPDAAMRYLLTSMIFCTAGAQGYPSNVYASPPLFGVVSGETLFETLVYTLVPLESITFSFDDPAVLWRNQGSVTQKAEVGATSWLRGMLFPTRRIHLCPETDGTVRQVYYSQGENYVNKDAWRDPFATYRASETGISPLRPHREMPIWRNLNDIIDIPGGYAAHVLRQYMRLHPSEHAVLTLYGVETNQASYLGEMRIDLLLPMGISRDGNHVEWVERCITDAEDLARALKKSLATSGAASDSKCTEAGQLFYAATGEELLSLCEKAAVAEAAELPSLRREWDEQLARRVIRQYDSTIASLQLRGRALASAAEAKKNIFFAIKKQKEVIA